MLKIKILSALASILITTFLIGFGLYLTTDHIELMAISGITILLIFLYFCFKWMLEDLM